MACRDRSPAFALALLLQFTAPVLAAQSDGPLRLLPDRISEGSDLVIGIADGPPAAFLTVHLSAGRYVRDLGEIRLDRGGRATSTFMLPADAAAGDYVVSVRSDLAGVLDTDPLTITAAPTLVFDRSVAYPQQTVAFSADDLLPGIVELHLGRRIVFGPVAVAQTGVQGEFQMPRGGPEVLDAMLISRTGQRITGVAIASLTRGARTVERPRLNSAITANAIRRGRPFTVTGSLQVPEGTAVTDYQWTFYWKPGGGSPVPVNIAPVRFDPATRGNRDGSPVDFNLDAIAPTLSAGYPLADITELDEWGFVYVNPDTGESGITDEVGPPPGSLDDEAGITVTGRLVEFDGNSGQNDDVPIPGAIWTVLPKTRLIEPGTTIDFGGAAKAAGGGPVNTASALAHGNNEVAAAAATNLGVTLPGCEPSLANGITNQDGEFAFAFSPQLTEILRTAYVKVAADAGGQIEVYPIPDPPRDEFLVRLSGLTRGFGIPVEDDNPNVDLYGGLFYEFRRDKDGVYFFRQGREGPFNQQFDPTRVLVSAMPQIPPGAVLTLGPNSIHMPQLSRGETLVGSNGFNREQFGTIVSFPSQAGTDLDHETATFEMTWGLGPVDAVVTIGENAEFSAVLSTAEGQNTCGLVNQTLRAEIPGLATWPLPPGEDRVTVPGEVRATTPDNQTFFGYFDIAVERAPSWWQDPAYQDFRISWSPNHVTIIAEERPKSNDASVQGVPKDVGDLDNTNAEPSARAIQSIFGGIAGGIERLAAREQNVANQPSSQTASGKVGRVALTHRAEQVWQVPLELPVLPEDAKAIDDDCLPGQPTVECLRARAGSASELDSDSILIIDTGKIPIFRYAWGVPPIAAATLGADIWFKAMLSYYIYLEFADFQVDLDSLIEPEVAGGLDIFFDLSALGGIVSAKVAASPGIGVGMPIVITNNAFNSEDSGPCFQFILDLIVQLNLGFCPACLEHEISERLLEFKRPKTCSVSLFGKGLLAKANVPPPAGGKVGLATDGAGTTAAVYATENGMKAQLLLAGQPAGLQDLDSGPGAMRPEAAFFDAGKAVAVWAQSSLDARSFEALPDAAYDDPSHCADEQQEAGCPTTTPEAVAGTRFQHLVYAIFENDQWGPTGNLTTPTTGEGGVALAACRGGDPGCPARGEILAVWERDMAGDIRQNDLALYWAIFDGATRTWSPVLSIDRGTARADLQPSPLYVQGEPAVVWVREPAGVGIRNLASRELWYEFLDRGAGPRQAAGVLPAVASPSAEALSSNGFAVAFTRSTDTSYFGNRRGLWLARARNCATGVCSWIAFEPRDQTAQNRRQFVEQPKLLVRSNDDLTIIGRRVGVDGAFIEGESIGVVTSAGDLFRMEFDAGVFDQGVAQSLTDDGGVNWLNQAVVDDTVGSLIVFNDKGLGVAEQPGAQFATPGAKSALVSRPVGSVLSKGLDGGSTGYFLHLQPTGPDLALTSASTVAERVVPGGTVEVDFEVLDYGAAVNGKVEVGAYWDGGPGVGLEGGLIAVEGVGNGPVEGTITVAVPPGFAEDETHRLVLVANPEQQIAEADFTNNHRSVTLGTLPAPASLRPAVDFAGTVAFLDWEAAPDDRVAGYRVYRRVLGSETVNAVGYSTLTGFADLNVQRGVEYEYRVASVSPSLIESQPSDWVRVSVGPRRTGRVFRNGFEQPGPLQREPNVP